MVKRRPNKEKVLEFLFNRQSLTILKDSGIIFLSVILGGIISSLITNPINVYVGLLRAGIIMLLIVIVLVIWNIYDKPRRINSYFQLNTIEGNTNDIKYDVETIKTKLNIIERKVDKD